MSIGLQKYFGCAILPSMEALITYMRAKRLSQTTLARQLGVHQAVLSRWVNPDPAKRRTPSGENLKRISEITGISLAKLVRDL
jgi:transcriptional regulator with XRE-family HTH domain